MHMDQGQTFSSTQVPGSMDGPVSFRDQDTEQPPPPYSTLPPEHSNPPSYHSLTEHPFDQPTPMYTKYQMHHPKLNQPSHGASYQYDPCVLILKPFYQSNFSAPIKPPTHRTLRNFQPKCVFGLYDIRVDQKAPESQSYWTSTWMNTVNSPAADKLSLTGAICLACFVMWSCGFIFGLYALIYAGIQCFLMDFNNDEIIYYFII